MKKNLSIPATITEVTDESEAQTEAEVKNLETFHTTTVDQNISSDRNPLPQRVKVQENINISDISSEKKNLPSTKTNTSCEKKNLTSNKPEIICDEEKQYGETTRETISDTIHTPENKSDSTCISSKDSQSPKDNVSDSDNLIKNSLVNQGKKVSKTTTSAGINFKSQEYKRNFLKEVKAAMERIQADYKNTQTNTVKKTEDSAKNIVKNKVKKLLPPRKNANNWKQKLKEQIKNNMDRTLEQLSKKKELQELEQLEQISKKNELQDIKMLAEAKLVGSLSSKSANLFKIRAKIKDKTVSSLVDSGAQVFVISPRMMKYLKKAVNPSDQEKLDILHLKSVDNKNIPSLSRYKFKRVLQLHPEMEPLDLTVNE